MAEPLDRREFLKGAAGTGAVAGALGLALTGCGRPGAAPPPAAATTGPAPAKALPDVPDHTLTVISGKPRERGRRYGRKYKDEIHAFLDREFYGVFTQPPSEAFSDAGIYGGIYMAPKKPPTREELRGYAGGCAKEIKSYSPVVMDELEGMAEGTGLSVEEMVLLTLHEELGHGGQLPHVHHCTAVAAGPPDTGDGNTYVGQNWDWMQSAFGRSTVLYWQRPEGPGVLAYGYPGLWVGAGLNSAGVALCWTSGTNRGITGPRVGIPSYVLIAQMLYQPTLKDAVAEAKRAKQAGWFVFVLADGDGNLASVEGSPKELAVEQSRGHLARWLYGTRQMTRQPDGQEVPRHPRCQRMCDLLAGARGKLDRPTLQGFFGDHHSDGQAWSTVCTHFTQEAASGTVDSMLFDTTRREAYVSRGPACSGRWKKFTFADA